MALHEQCVGATGEWYTPPCVFEALGCKFDLDVASPGMCYVPWIPTKSAYSSHALQRPWKGFVWMNPPFGGRNGLVPWLARFLDHGNGIALVPDRTSAPWFQDFVPKCDKVLFVAPKIRFISPSGEPGKSPAQGTALCAIGVRGVAALKRAAGAGLGKLATFACD